MTFGNLFKNINLKYFDANGVERERIKVPIQYGPKEKWVDRLHKDPDLQRPTNVQLPRMSFEMKALNYARERKQNNLLRVALGDSASRVKSQYMGAPYDITFELNIYARNIDDGNQIIEQMLPYIQPDYTIEIEPIAEVGHKKDIPIIFNGLTTNVEYEGNSDKERFVYWTLTFTIQGYFWGPVTNPKIIRKVIANIWNDPTLVMGHITKMNLGAGSGNFIVEDTIYKGDRLETCTALGIVNYWNPDLKKLTVGGAHGTFNVGDTIRAASSNTTYVIESFDATPIKLAQIIIEPDPIDAEPDDDFGYSTTIREWPETDEDV